MKLFCDSIVGVVLAGGRGERLGLGRPKAWAPTPHGTLLDVALSNVLRPLHYALVAAPATMELPPLRVPPARSPSCDYEASRVDDLAEGEGPMAGIVPALERALEMEAEWSFILSVDLPAIRWKDIFHMWQMTPLRPYVCGVVLRGPEGIEPLCALLRPMPMAWSFRQAWDAGERSPRRVLEQSMSSLKVLDVNDPGDWPSGPDVLRSVNTPEDLARAFAEPAA